MEGTEMGYHRNLTPLRGGSKAAKVTQESDRGPAAGGPERAGRLIPFGNIPFSPSHVCSVSHLRPKAGGEWMSFRFLDACDGSRFL